MGTNGRTYARSCYTIHTMNSAHTGARLFPFTILFFMLVLFPHVSDAALLYFDPTTPNAYRGDSVVVTLRIDTDEGECINTVDATVHYDESVRAVDVSRGDSILSVWLEDPEIDESAHTISFVGGIPGGYCGRIPGDPSFTNVLARFVFRSPGLSVGSRSPSARIWVDDSAQVLLHDGLGTPAVVRLEDAVISLPASPGGETADPWREAIVADDVPPADFSITLTRDEVAFSRKYFIVFNSTDKQSGIDHFEVMEEPFSEFYRFSWGRADAPWVRVESPYVLIDQSLNSTIRVKAIDKAGNERMATLVPEDALRGMSRDAFITTIIAVCGVIILTALGYFFYWRRRRFNAELIIENHE